MSSYLLLLLFPSFFDLLFCCVCVCVCVCEGEAPLAQWIARWTSNPKVVGSSPARGVLYVQRSRRRRRRRRAHLAQEVERWPFKPMVVGSIPTVGVCERKQHKRTTQHNQQQASELAQRKRVGLITQRSEDRNLDSLRTKHKPKQNQKNIFFFFLLGVGFEPTHPKITELKSAALDHSAIQALY